MELPDDDSEMEVVVWWNRIPAIVLEVSQI
jgi:hypothetical protein